MVKGQERLVFGNFELDTARRALQQRGGEVRLTPKEYLTLELLVKQAGHAVSKEALLANGWPGTTVGDTSLARCISSLRKHLGNDAIEAVPKFGYRFTLPVSLVEAPSSPAASQSQSDGDIASPPTVSIWRTSGARVAGAVAVAVLIVVVGLSAARFIHPRPSAAVTPTVWTDTQTNLMWAGKDNGSDVTRQQAMDYCRDLTLAGHHDWRLPTIDELQTLYDPGVSIGGIWGPNRSVYWHVKGHLHLTGGETAENLTWLTDLTPAGEEQSFDFSFGRRNYDAVTFGADHRALCMRGETK